jgi:phage-related protein (TIGR01555 family)
MLTREELDALYMHWVCERVVDYVADDITRAGWTVKLGTDSTAKEIPGIKNAFAALNAEDKFNEAIKSARQYGGSAVIMYLDDGMAMDQPVNWERLRGVTGLEPVDRWHLRPVYDINIVRYSEPEKYDLNILEALGSGPKTIHSQRVLRINGRRLPFRIAQNNEGWGKSEIQPILEALTRRSGSLGDVQQMLSDLDLFTHKIKGLATMLASGKERQVKDRLAVNDMSRSQYRGFAIDADKEEIEWNSRNCNGLAEVLMALKEELVGATGFPSTILFGESPKGMGSTGRSEERDYCKLVENYRHLRVRGPLTQLAYALLKSKGGPTRGRVPKEWAVGFPSLYVMNERETADHRARVAAADYRYWVMGSVTSDEIAMSRFGGAEYSTETTLNMQNREANGSLKEEKVVELLRMQGKIDPVEKMKIDKKAAEQPDGPPGIRGLSKTGERSDPTDNENGTMNINGEKSVSSGDPGGDE